ncbi:hypothetical protein GW915_09505 [bacterium]|nr:hypothetical protein [bacterium]
MAKYKSLYPAFILLLLAVAILYQSRAPKNILQAAVVKELPQPAVIVGPNVKESEPAPQPARIFIFKLRGMPKHI